MSTQLVHAPSLPEDKREPQARLTVVYSVYHSIPQQQPNGPQPIRYSRLLETTETAYSRTVRVTEQWEPLDIGWLKEVGCSYIVLENDSIRPLGVTPTREERGEWSAKIIEYGVSVGDDIVSVGHLLPEEGTGFSPTHPERIQVRCKKGEGKLTYFVVPM